MNRKKSLGTGSVSLILIFCVLCLTIFALLTLSSARSENMLTEKLAGSASNFYAADVAAAEAMAGLENELSKGSRPDSIQTLEMSYTEKNGQLFISYLSPIDENRAIAVLLKYSGEIEILQWQEVPTSDWEPDENLPVLFS